MRCIARKIDWGRCRRRPKGRLLCWQHIKRPVPWGRSTIIGLIGLMGAIASIFSFTSDFKDIRNEDLQSELKAQNILLDSIFSLSHQMHHKEQIGQSETNSYAFQAMSDKNQMGSEELVAVIGEKASRQVSEPVPDELKTRISEIRKTIRRIVEKLANGKKINADDIESLKSLEVGPLDLYQLFSLPEISLPELHIKIGPSLPIV